jgi:hypothetical protein
MIRVICNSKAHQTQSMGEKDEPVDVYEATFRVRTEGNADGEARFTVMLTKSEFERYEVNKIYTLS